MTNKLSVLVAAAVLGLGACGGGGGGSGDDMGGDGYGGSGGDDGGGGGGSAGTTCPEIVDCFDACTTDACMQDCIDAGSTDAQDLIYAVLDCVQQNNCTDSACVQTNCGSQLDACYADSGTGTGGGGGGGPTGDPLPSSLVGTWGTSQGNATIIYTFTADGQVSYSGGLYTGWSGCDSKTVWVYDGVVHLAGDQITLTPTAGTVSNYGCSGTLDSQQPYTDVEQDRFATGVDAEGAVLQLTDLSTGNVTTYHHQ